jgi:rhodanese-related sulfurtransferase
MNKMNNLFLLAAILLSVCQLNFAQSSNSVSSINSVSANEFNKLVSSGNYTLLDIRTTKEFEEGHINSAINIDFYNREFEQKILLYKSVPVLIYSRSSGQSKQALNKLSELNFEKVVELENGIVAWKREGLPLVK